MNLVECFFNEKGVMEMNSRTIYIVLTNTNTMLSRAIRYYTRSTYNHISIAFDYELQEMYSFGRKQMYNPFIGGFVKEDTTHKLLQKAQCLIYSVDVSEEQYEMMRNKIRYFERNAPHYRYNFIGLFGVALNIEIERKNAYFCSQFVATVFEEGGTRLFEVKPLFVQPQHFCHVPSFQREYCGTIEAYLKGLRIAKKTQCIA